MELPGTVAASRPPEAARNCLRSIEFAGEESAAVELLADALWSDEFLGHDSWGSDVMRVTSAKPSNGIRQTIVLRHYTTAWRINKHRKIDFLGESPLWRERNWIEGI